MAPIPSIVTPDGIERRLGLIPPEMRVSALPSIESSQPNNLLTPDQIKQLITDPGRTPREQIFSDDHWVVEGDQKSHGSCNGWAGASVLSKTRFLRGITDGLVLSGSYVYSWINNNEDNGSALDRGMAELLAHGAPPASLCDANQIYRKQTQAYDDEAAKHLGLQAYAAETQQGFDSGIALGYLGVVAVQVNNAFSNYKGSGICPTGNGPGNHAIHVDDAKYVNGVLWYHIVNNWNLTWGLRGKGWVTWSAFAQPFKYQTFYLVPATIEAGM